jgi:hypothetical protein
LTEEQVNRMGFGRFESVEEALARIFRELPREKRRVDVVPWGGSSYPYLETEEERSS